MALQQLDVRGEICPYPMMKTVQALKKLKGDDLGLEVITDHAPALETIPTQAARLGYTATIEETGSPEWTITLTKGSGA
jgi:tRNA 2-thiouridine synthesizing protein A